MEGNLWFTNETVSGFARAVTEPTTFQPGNKSRTGLGSRMRLAGSFAIRAMPQNNYENQHAGKSTNTNNPSGSKKG